MKSETASKNDENKMIKRKMNSKSDKILVSEYATHFWMRAIASIWIEDMKTMFPGWMYRAYEEDVFPDECREEMYRAYEEDVSKHECV